MQERQQAKRQESTQKIARNQVMNYATQMQGTMQTLCKKCNKEVGKRVQKKSNKQPGKIVCIKVARY